MWRYLAYFSVLLFCVQAEAQSLDFSGIATSTDGTMVTLETDAGELFLLFEGVNSADLTALISKTVTGSCSLRGDLCVVLNYEALTEEAATSDED